MTKEEFKIFFEEYFDPIRNYIYYKSGDEQLATDIAQESFIKIWEKKLDPQKHKLKSLAYKVAHDLFISSYRRSELHNKYLKEIKFQFNESFDSEELEYKELKNRYEKALAALPVKQREVFLMSRIEELKYYEIAERLEISVKAVEKRMKNALGFLRIEIAKE